MPRKLCRRCGRTKALSKFYKHPAMKDGHLNFCKECVKKRVRDRWAENAEELRAKERTRNNKDNMSEERKQNRLAYQRRNRTKEYRRAHNAIRQLIRHGERPDHCSVCKKSCVPEGHHPDYLKPKEVVWTCSVCHVGLDKERRRKTSLKGVERMKISV